MSVDMRERKSKQEDTLALKEEQEQQSSLSNLIDQIQLRNLGNYYAKEESLFKKRIDKLNLKFYLETEKYLNNDRDKEFCQDQLFVILFKQISLYIEEIERLNKIAKESSESDPTQKEELNKKEKETFSSRYTIRSMKNTIKQLEKKVNDYLLNEDKLKKEIDSLKRQLSFHNDKLQFDITMKKAEDMKKKTMKKISKTKMAVKDMNGTEKERDSSFHTKNNSREVLSSKENEQPEKQDIAGINKILIKKRNNSDNNPSAENLDEMSSKTMFKKRYENNSKENVEVNNININLNLHLKNSNNANINVNNINSSMIEKREAAKSSNTNKLNKNAVNTKTSANDPKTKITVNQKNTIAKKDQVSMSVNFGNMNKSNKLTTLKKSPVQAICSPQEYFQNDQSINIKTPSFVSQFEEAKLNLNLSNSLDLAVAQEIITSTFNKFDEELADLGELEQILRLAKQEMLPGVEESVIDSEFNRLEPLSDSEEYFPNQVNNNGSSSALNSPTFQSHFNKKNPLLTSVTIDLIKNNEKNKADNLTINNCKYVKKTSESNKLDNVILAKCRNLNK